ELRMIGSDTVDVAFSNRRPCVSALRLQHQLATQNSAGTRTCRATAARLSRRPGLSLLATIEPVSEWTLSKASLEVTNSRGLLAVRPARCFGVHCAKLHGCLWLFRSDCSAARFGKFDGVAGSGILEAAWRA